MFCRRVLRIGKNRPKYVIFTAKEAQHFEYIGVVTGAREGAESLWSLRFVAQETRNSVKF